MLLKTSKSHPISILFAIAATCLSLLLACGGDNGNSEDRHSSTGALAFMIAYQGDNRNAPARAAVMDCTGQGIVTVEAAVYGTNNGFLAGGGPWDCDAGHGSISAVPAGGGRTVVVLGKDTNGYVIFRGQKSGITVAADSVSNAGTINCSAFVPTLLDPPDGAVVQADTMELTWNSVSGAARYRVVVTEPDNLMPIIDTTLIEQRYAPLGLSISKTYNWQAFAVDGYGNMGIGSEIRSLTVRAGSVDTAPLARIDSPAEDAMFSASETIAFAGTGRDSEDGDLSGASLVWYSDVDGQFGTGETCTSSTLVAGAHLVTLEATDSNGSTATDSVAITIAAGWLPDTGQILSYTDIVGEDSDYSISPPSYTKLDAFGKALAADAADWAMIRDNVTGLIWEVKTAGDDTDIRYNGKTCAWWDIQNVFIMPLNNARFGGHSDWRLPTIKELYTILSNLKTYPGPKINPAYFPNTIPSNYWASDRDAVNPNNWWGLDFGSGGAVSNANADAYYVRAVRGAHSANSFVDNGDGTVTDRTTGLMWQQVDPMPTKVDWAGALQYCEALALGGYDDWRLPNAKELQSIVDYKRSVAPAIDSTFFPNTQPSTYWSSTTHADQTGLAWRVEFTSGNIGFEDKSFYFYARAVRGGR